ncbi:peptide transporter [Corynebacterium flavescens]|uniref:peptide transporter n=1 Tax=Corynebacterium flavescens TaxID=28028 RepID=UPI00264976E3|nr:peptide transporter [Corynebacterium flavescens]MDN6646684.1 peptide transporter [Corynebacterium flavescens]
MALPKVNKKTSITKPPTDSASKPATKMFAQANDKAARLQLYVKDKKLIKELKLAAVEDDLSISQLFEEWATAWLNQRNRK